MNAFKKLRSWCPQPPDRLPAKLKRYSMPIAAILTATLIFSVSFSVFYSNMLSHPSIPIVPLVVAQGSLPNFATDITAADEKVFTIDNWGIATCFNAQTGAKVWSTNAGGYTSYPQSITVYDGAVYAATAGGLVVSLNENTGKVLFDFQAPVDSSIGQKTPPNFYSVGGGYVFASSNGFAAYNANTGKLLWNVTDPILANPSSITPQTGAVYPLGDNVFIAAGDGVLGYYTDKYYRINPEDNSVLWTAPGYSSSPPLYSRGQVILWNEGPTSQEGETIVSVNASSGSTLWDFNVGASAYQPAVSNGLLLFGASDGNFYALNLTNGTIAWKKHVDTQNYMAGENLVANATFNTAPAVSPVTVDSENQRVFWGFVITQSGINGQPRNDRYAQILSCLSLNGGQTIWANETVNNGDGISPPISTTPPKDSVGLVVAENTLYLTMGTDLLRINASSGEILDTQHFDHYILPPVQWNGNVFIAADLYMLSYPTNENSKSLNNLSLILVTTTAVVIVAIAVLMFKRNRKSKAILDKGLAT